MIIISYMNVRLDFKIWLEREETEVFLVFKQALDQGKKSFFYCNMWSMILHFVLILNMQIDQF